MLCANRALCGGLVEENARLFFTAQTRAPLRQKWGRRSTMLVPIVACVLVTLPFECLQRLRHEDDHPVSKTDEDRYQAKKSSNRRQEAPASIVILASFR